MCLGRQRSYDLISETLPTQLGTFSPDEAQTSHRCTLVSKHCIPGSLNAGNQAYIGLPDIIDTKRTGAIPRRDGTCGRTLRFPRNLLVHGRAVVRWLDTPSRAASLSARTCSNLSLAPQHLGAPYFPLFGLFSASGPLCELKAIL